MIVTALSSHAEPTTCGNSHEFCKDLRNHGITNLFPLPSLTQISLQYIKLEMLWLINLLCT